MDPVKGINQVAQILRQKLSERSPDIAKSINTAATTAQASCTASKATPEEIKRKIEERIKALADEDQQGDKAVQIFVEVILTWEFGDQLLQDPKFTELSKEVAIAMNSNPETKAKLSTLLFNITS